MSPKDVALGLLKLALALFPPLAELVARAVGGTPDDHPLRPLADEVRELLPAEASIHDAVRELEERIRR